MRPITEVEVDKQLLIAILDSGAKHSYIREELAGRFFTVTIEPFQAKLGGQTLTFTKGKVVEGRVRDSDGNWYKFAEILLTIDDLGEEDGKKIDALFGAFLLEKWGALVDNAVTPPKIDYRNLRKGEFVEL